MTDGEATTAYGPLDDDLPEATWIAHWPTGPVKVCDDHLAQLRAVASALGTHIGVTPHAPDGTPCINCVNAAKRVR